MESLKNLSSYEDNYHNITGKGHGARGYQHPFNYGAYGGLLVPFMQWPANDPIKETPHYDKCSEFPLTCPNRCGARRIKRRNLASHCRDCPQEPVQCPFAEAGCKEDLRRCQLEDHMTSSIQQHLLLLMIDHKKLKEQLRK